jgi:hypothetical protein
MGGLWNPKVHCVVQKSPPLASVLNSIQMYSAEITCEDENWIRLVQDCAHWQGLVLVVLNELPVSLLNLCISKRKYQNKPLIYINM